MSKVRFNITELEELLIANKLYEATSKMKELFEVHEEEDLINQAIITLGRLNNYNKKSDQGVLDDNSTEFEKIRVAVVNMKSSVKVLLNPHTSTDNTRTSKAKENAKVIFEEHFDASDIANWLIESPEQQESSSAYYKNGRLFLENVSYVTIPGTIDPTRNFTIKTRITFLNGIDIRGYGLTWGYADTGNNFHFYISANGSFYIGYEIEGARIIVTKWASHPIIKKGMNANSLEIMKHGDLLHFKINGEMVHSTEFISFFDNRLGFAIGPETRVAVDFFQIIN